MAVEADSVVVTLLAQNEQFDAATKASAAGFQQSMGSIQTTASAAEKGVGQFSSALKENRLQMNNSRVGMMEFQHIARGVSDQMAAGAPITQVLGQHMAMLGEAVALSGGAFGKVGAFLGGPWGIALTLATTLAIGLISKHKEQASTVDDLVKKLQKHHDQTELNNEADRIWAGTIDGLIERTDKLNEQLKKRLETETQLHELTMREAQGNLASARAQAARLEVSPGTTQKQLDDANEAITKADVALHNAQVLGGEVAGQASASLAKSAKQFADAQLAVIRTVQGVHPELAEKGPSAQLAASWQRITDAIDGAAAAELNFSDTRHEVDKLDDKLVHGSISVKTYTTEIAKLAESLKAATAQAKELNKNPIEAFKSAVIGAEGTGPNRLGSSAAGFGQFMPGTFEGYFKRLYPQQASGMSNTDIDALRSNRTIATAVIDAATKDYVTVIQRAGQQITAASLYTVHLLGAGDARKLLAAPSGESTSSFLSAAVLRGNPFLRGTAGDARAAIGKRIGDSSSAVSSGAVEIQKQRDDLAKKAADQEAAFNSELDRLNTELIKARGDQVKDALAQLDFSEDEVRSEQKRRDDSYQSAVTTGKLTQSQADQLIAVDAAVAAEKIRALELQKQVEIVRRQDEIAEREAGYREEDLRAAEQGATSQAQRRELDLAILDILYDEKLEHLKSLEIRARMNGDLQAQADAQAQIARLPQQKANDANGIIQGTLDPLQSWLHSVPHDAQAVTAALQGIATNGFDNLANSIAGVVTGTQSLGAAFKNIARQIVGDIVQMTIKMLIFRAISSALGGGVPSFSTGSFESPTFSGPAVSVPQLAGGGFGIIGGMGGTDNNLLSLNGQGIAWVSKGEGLEVRPSGATAASPFGSTHAMVRVLVEASPYFDGRVIDVAGPVIAQAASHATVGGSALARENLSRQALHTLR